MSKSRTTTQEASPWAPAQPALQEVITGAQNLYASGGFGRTPYQGNRVAGFSDQTERALGSFDRGLDLQDPSIAAIEGILSDDQMYRDFDTIKGVVADDVKAALGSTFSGGSINSSLAGDTYTRALTEALAAQEYGAYSDAQNRKLSALGLAPSIAGMGRGALGAGVMRDQLAQRQIDADMALYDETQNTDLRALQDYASIAGTVGGMGGSSSKTEPVSLFETLSGIGKAASGIGGFWEAVF